MTASSDPNAPVANDSALDWTWQRGGTATVVSLDGLHIEVHSSAPYPPGAPLIAHSSASASVSSTTFEVKVRGCRKLPSGKFAITGSLVNLTRDLRLTLASALASRSNTSQ